MDSERVVGKQEVIQFNPVCPPSTRQHYLVGWSPWASVYTWPNNLRKLRIRLSPEPFGCREFFPDRVGIAFVFSDDSSDVMPACLARVKNEQLLGRCAS
jgi:hypothetical protein